MRDIRPRRRVRGRIRLGRGLGRALRVQLPKLAFLAVLGPGLVSGFADNDAGGITTYSVVGAQFGYALLWVVLASMVALFVTQEVGARLGLATGRGLLDLIREGFGIRWAALAIVTMLLANLGTTLAEFAGIGAALSLFGVPVPVSVVVSVLVVGLLLVAGRVPARPVRLPRGRRGRLGLLRRLGDPREARLGQERRSTWSPRTDR